MKILYIFGDNDYTALEFENLPLGRRGDIISKAKEDINELIEWDCGCYVKVMEFNNVDESFIDFIKNEIQDYDDSKHKNFYVLNN